MLNRTKAYDFCNVDERGEWFDVFVALIKYLLSGESKVGFLNNSHPRNLIHKVWASKITSVANGRKLRRSRRRGRLKRDQVSLRMILHRRLKMFRIGRGNEKVFLCQLLQVCLSLLWLIVARRSKRFGKE